MRRLVVPVLMLALLLPELGPLMVTPAGAATPRAQVTRPAPCPTPQPRQVWHIPAKEAMLTFDDGPSPRYTPILLAILKKYHVQATFFLIGENAQRNPEVVREILAAGMVIGNHSWDHPDLERVSSARLSTEIDRTSAVLTSITGSAPCFFRFPYGAASAADIAAVNERGLTPMLWTVDTRDWAGASTSAIVSTVWRELSSSHGAVILQHDIQGPRTLDAVPTIIAGLRARGYSFVTAYQGKPSP
jgi:peptidoglycan-N-acetylglucosamine deacetylase